MRYYQLLEKNKTWDKRILSPSSMWFSRAEPSRVVHTSYDTTKCPT